MDEKLCSERMKKTEEHPHPINGVEGDYWYIRNKKVLLTPYINGTRAKKVLVVQGGAATEIK